MELAAVGTVLIAMGGILKLVFDHLTRQSKEFATALLAQQSRQETFLGNHMSANVRILTALEASMVVLHEDNKLAASLLKKVDAHTAKTLKEADSNVTRKVEAQNQTVLRKRLDRIEEEDEPDNA